jgi:hypothetical protein
MKQDPRISPGRCPPRRRDRTRSILAPVSPPVGAVKQLRPDRRPVLLQVRAQCADAHSIDTCGPLVALHLRQRLTQIVSLDNRFHRRPIGRPAFEFGLRRSELGPFRAGASGFTRRPVRKVIPISFLPHSPREIAVLLAIPSFGGSIMHCTSNAARRWNERPAPPLASSTARA